MNVTFDLKLFNSNTARKERIKLPIFLNSHMLFNFCKFVKILKNLNSVSKLSALYLNLGKRSSCEYTNKKYTLFKFTLPELFPHKHLKEKKILQNTSNY